MTQPFFELGDVRRDEIRSACSALDEALSRLPAENEVRARWTKLVELLELEPARRLRECPVCKHVGILEATRCGHCWTKLARPTPDDELTYTTGTSGSVRTSP